MIIGKKMDWLQGTLTDYGTIKVVLPEFEFKRVHDGAHGYADMLVNDETGIRAQQGAKRDDMGTHIQMGGSALSVMRSHGFTDNSIVERMHKYGFRASRLDLCIDVFDGEMLPIDYKRALESGKAITRMGKPLFLEKDDNGFVGTTLYIGAHTSNRFVRIYDKRAEQKVYLAGNWVRLEMVFQRKGAKAIFGALTQHSVADVVNSAFGAAFKLPNTEYEKLIVGGSAIIDAVKRPKTNTEKWLMETVVSALSKVLHQNPEFGAEFFDALAAEMERLRRKNE